MSDKTWNRIFFFSIIAMGVSHVVTQLTLLREFLALFYGNELTIGVILANWMLLSGIGAYAGRYFRRFRLQLNFFLFFQTIAVILPIIAVFLLRILRDKIFIRGEMLSLMHIFLSTFIFLAPYCLITGMAITIACSLLSTRRDSQQIGTVYFLDSIGDITGGLLFSFIFIYLFDSFRSLYIPAAINLMAVILFSAINRRRIFSIAVILLTTALFIFAGRFNAGEFTIKRLYEGQEVILYKDTRYGKLIVTKLEDQFNFFENGSLLYSTDDIIHAEETTHYALAQTEKPQLALLISGGITGTAKEILKHGVKRVDYVELDPMVFEIGRRYTNNLDDYRIHTIAMDGRLFVETSTEKYDAIILDLAVPSTIQINRFYTIEFFRRAKSIIKDSGVLSIGIVSSENFPQGRDSSVLARVLYKTLKEVFREVIIIPGDHSYFIASDSPLTYDIIQRLDDKNIATEYIKYYAGSKLTKDRIDKGIETAQGGETTNTDFHPVICFYTLRYWLSLFNVSLKTVSIIAGILLVIYLISLRAISFSVFTTGFSAAGLEIVIIIGFQILYGYLYSKISVIITVFMIGLAAGSFYSNRTLQRRTISSLKKAVFLLAFISAAIPFLLFGLSNLSGWTMYIIGANLFLPVIIFAIAFVVGFIFPLAAMLLKRDVAKTAGTLYCADFIGASIGAISVSAALIPLIGIINTCLLTAGLNILSGSMLFFRKKLIS